MFELHWTYGVDRALGALGVSDRSTLDGGDNEIIQCDHYNQDENAEDVSKQRYRVEDKEYRVRCITPECAVTPGVSNEVL